MNLTNAAELGGAAIVIPMILALIKSVWLTMPDRFIMVTVAGLALAWGGILVYSGQLHVDLPTFIVSWLLTTFGASGVREHAVTLVPSLSDLALLEKKPTPPAA